MTARLIAHTVPVAPEFGTTAHEFIAYVARVSNPANQWNHETASRLCQYLQDHKHWSPFELFHIVVEVETTRDIARQLLRHRGFTFQEFSQRYAAVTDEPVFREARLQDVKNRQNSLETDDAALEGWWKNAQSSIMNDALWYYNDALKRGIAKEVARAVLPEGLTPSRLYVAGSVRQWLHYLEVRLDPSTQKEHRILAGEIEKVVRSVLTRDDKGGTP